MLIIELSFLESKIKELGARIGAEIRSGRRKHRALQTYMII